MLISRLEFKIKKYIRKRNFILRQQVRQWLHLNLITEILQFQSDEISYQIKVINELKEVIKERTEYHLDVHSNTKRNSQVILIGKYHNRDFVKCYDIPDQEFNYLIQHLRELEKYTSKGRIDAMYGINAVINNKLKDVSPELL